MKKRQPPVGRERRFWGATPLPHPFQLKQSWTDGPGVCVCVCVWVCVCVLLCPALSLTAHQIPVMISRVNTVWRNVHLQHIMSVQMDDVNISVVSMETDSLTHRRYLLLFYWCDVSKISTLGSWIWYLSGLNSARTRRWAHIKEKMAAE